MYKLTKDLHDIGQYIFTNTQLFFCTYFVSAMSLLFLLSEEKGAGGLCAGKLLQVFSGCKCLLFTFLSSLPSFLFLCLKVQTASWLRPQTLESDWLRVPAYYLRDLAHVPVLARLQWG